MDESKSFMYDDFSDRLFISCNRDASSITGSIRLLNLVIDFTSDMKVANIELKKASDYLESLGVDSKILNKLTDAKITLKQCRDGYLICFILKSGKIVERIPYNICSIKSPVPINS